MFISINTILVHKKAIKEEKKCAKKPEIENTKVVHKAFV